MLILRPATSADVKHFRVKLIHRMCEALIQLRLMTLQRIHLLQRSLARQSLVLDGPEETG